MVPEQGRDVVDLCLTLSCAGWRDSPLTVIRVTEGQDVTLECPFKQLLLVNPPASCLLHTDRDVCLPYFQPQLTFNREENPWRGRFTVKFLEMAASVTISELKKDDAGRYICRVQAPSGATMHSIFQIIVEGEIHFELFSLQKLKCCHVCIPNLNYTMYFVLHLSLYWYIVIIHHQILFIVYCLNGIMLEGNARHVT